MTQDKAEQKSLIQKSGDLIADIFDDDLQTSDTETSIELNFAVLKFKHTIKKKKHWAQLSTGVIHSQLISLSTQHSSSPFRSL